MYMYMYSDLLQAMCDFLLSVCTEESDLVVKAESLDCIMDVFSESKFDKVLRQTNALDKLRAIQRDFKTQVSARSHPLDSVFVPAVDSNYFSGKTREVEVF